MTLRPPSTERSLLRPADWPLPGTGRCGGPGAPGPGQRQSNARPGPITRRGSHFSGQAAAGQPDPGHAERRAGPRAPVWLDQPGGKRAANAYQPRYRRLAIGRAEPDARTIVASAPGFFSQAQALGPQASLTQSVQFRLTPLPGLRRMPWGSGDVSVPPETQAHIAGQQIDLDSGWLWGAGASSEPWVIHTAGAVITLTAANSPWLTCRGNPPGSTSYKAMPRPIKTERPTRQLT